MSQLSVKLTSLVDFFGGPFLGYKKQELPGRHIKSLFIDKNKLPVKGKNLDMLIKKGLVKQHRGVIDVYS